MRLEELQLFRRAAALGALAAAAREMSLSPAAASARLQSLERSVGATLFSRSTRRLALTEEGETLLAHAERALDELEEARQRLGGGAEHPTGVLRFTVNEPFALKHVLPHLPEFRRRYPDVAFDMHLSDAFVDLAADGFELAIRIGPLADSALIAVKLAPNRRVLVASPAYLAAHGAPSRPEDLPAHDLISHRNILRWRLTKASAAAAPEEREVRVSGSFSCNSTSVTRDAALHGLGISLKSIWDVGDLLKSGALVQVLPDWHVEASGAIWAVRPPARYASSRARALVEFLRERYGPTPYWEVA